jgi:phosphomannomutase
MAVILEMMAMSGRTISELREEIPRYSLVKEKIAVPAEETPEILRTLRREYRGEKINLLDGVHVELDDSWFHVRMSNTEPVVRVVTEAPTREEAIALSERIKSKIQAGRKGA